MSVVQNLYIFSPPCPRLKEKKRTVEKLGEAISRQKERNESAELEKKEKERERALDELEGEIK